MQKNVELACLPNQTIRLTLSPAPQGGPGSPHSRIPPTTSPFIKPGIVVGQPIQLRPSFPLGRGRSMIGIGQPKSTQTSSPGRTFDLLSITPKRFDVVPKKRPSLRASSTTSSACLNAAGVALSK